MTDAMERAHAVIDRSLALARLLPLKDPGYGIDPSTGEVFSDRQLRLGAWAEPILRLTGRETDDELHAIARRLLLRPVP